MLRCVALKGTVSRDFRPLVFSSNYTPGSPDSWDKTVLHIDSNARSNSIRFDYENRIELLGQFESVFKTTLAHESGDPGVPFKEKTEGRKSRETVLLTVVPNAF
jgi:hypothetical protein